MSANDKQVDGNHYRSKIQHWDYVVANDLDYFQGQITKYVTRWKLKNGLVDLHKARHFLEKYIEVEQRKADETCGDNGEPTSGYVNQD
jgi:hypothetical protein